ncbi:MAG: hypothetical protein OEW36_05480, partial [Hylemonella sp.]|nr:hypothetical protein [Hylemonella sp.]
MKDLPFTVLLLLALVLLTYFLQIVLWLPRSLGFVTSKAGISARISAPMWMPADSASSGSCVRSVCQSCPGSAADF